MNEVEGATGATEGPTVSQRLAQCENAAVVGTALVQPFIAGTLGYDVADPLVVTPDSSGSTNDVNLAHPDARIEYAIRRNGLPVILIAVHHRAADTGEIAPEDAAAVRLRQCLEQSTAGVGATTDGRRWEWYIDVGDNDVRGWGRVDMASPTGEARGLHRCLSHAGWNPAIVREDVIVRLCQEEIVQTVSAQLAAPGPELLRWIGSLLGEGARTPRAAERIRHIAPDALREAARVLLHGKAPSRRKPSERLPRSVKGNALLRVDSTEADWKQPAHGLSQNELLGHTLDYLAGKPRAEEAFAHSQQMTRDFAQLSEATRASTARYWSGKGWYTSTVRRLPQKIRLINEIAKLLQVDVRAASTD